jgi:hypothetical protein
MPMQRGMNAKDGTDTVQYMYIEKKKKIVLISPM